MVKMQLFDNEQMMYRWWLKVRWFLVLVLFAIGILRVKQLDQMYPVFMFIGTFIGISILNILFNLQIIKTNIAISAFQILLDIVFSTLVVHLTGGIESSFVWIYLIPVITASLAVEKSGGFIAAMIGSMCLLLLIIMYNFNWLIPIDGYRFSVDVPNQTIFLISYTGLFSGIAFISSYIGEMVKKLSFNAKNTDNLITVQRDQLEEKCAKLSENKALLQEYNEIVKTAAGLASIDHDLNNPLSVISLSVSRVKRAAGEYEDEKLTKSSNQITEAIIRINGILTRLQDLKRLRLIQEERKKINRY